MWNECEQSHAPESRIDRFFKSSITCRDRGDAWRSSSRELCNGVPIAMNRRRDKRSIANGGLPPGAVAADTSQQIPISTYGSPKKFYVDINFTCRDCSRDETWTAEQQKWFYEVAKGSLYATANRCRECRNKLRDSKESQRTTIVNIEQGNAKDRDS